jgi:hypothetical protein
VFAPTMQGDAGAEVARLGPQDPPVTVKAMPLGSQVPTEGLEVAVSPTVTADPTAAIPSDTPPAVGVGARPALPRRQLRWIQRLFSGDHSGLATDQKQH